MSKTDDSETRILSDYRRSSAGGEITDRNLPDGDDLTRLAPSTGGEQQPCDPDSLDRTLAKELTKMDVPSDLSADAQGESQQTRIAINPARTGENLRTFHPGMLIKNRFKLVEEMGRGGMGVVYSARDLVQEGVGETNSLIAIKLLSEAFVDHPDALIMLQQETQKTRKLAHPNIINVYDFDRDGDTVYMTMELMSGQSLKDYMKECNGKTFSLDEVLPMITGIAEGLKYAHEKNIIHSDLKPENIFLTESGVKILDFGIARAAMHSDQASTVYTEVDDNAQITEHEEASSPTGAAFALTPSYASLEMFLGEPPDPADDIYAFACICYQLLVYKHPYNKLSALKAFEKGLVPNQIEGLKEPQWKALLAGLALERSNRPASVDEFIDSLIPHRREPWKNISIGVVLFASLLLGFFLTRPPEIVAPSLFENPPPAIELNAEQKLQVEQMLEVAEVHMMVDRLLSPPGSNALDEYNKVLEINPYNRDAITGLKELLDKLLRVAQLAVEKKDVERAKQVVEEGLKIHPTHKDLLLLQKDLDALNK